ncbi:MAG TPA: hypothetical protein VGL53_17300 [Bryobacteraceae bacterium]|jgi:hypothetical protein
MKTTEVPMVHEETNSRMSKAKRQGEMFDDVKRQPSESRMSPIPIEWLDPDCWRLPSGKALAEFALQAGFLAPLMLGLSKPKRQQVKRALPEGVCRSGESGAEPGETSQKIVRHGTRPASGAGKRL